MHGVAYWELPTQNVKRAKDFYAKVFGWTFQDVSKDYTMFTPAGGGISGGLTKVKAVPKKAAVRVYIEVADIDAKLAEIKKARGKVLKAKTLISPEFGSWAQFADNQGAVLFLWEQA